MQHDATGGMPRKPAATAQHPRPCGRHGAAGPAVHAGAPARMPSAAAHAGGQSASADAPREGRARGRERSPKRRGESHEKGMGAAGRWRRDHRPHVRLVASGMPSGRMRPASACQGRQARESGGGSGASHHAGGAVPALPRAEGLRVPSRPHHASHEARPEGPRQGRVGAHHVGRGVRSDLHQGERGQGNVRPGGHHGLRRHRPHRLHLLSHDRPQRVRHAQRVLRAKRHGLLLSPRHRNGLRRGKRLSRDRLCQPLSRPLRPSRLGAAQVHPGLGQGAAQVQSRRPVGAFRRRPHEAGLEGDLRRSARDVARLAGGHGPATASRHGRRPGHRPW